MIKSLFFCLFIFISANAYSMLPKVYSKSTPPNSPRTASPNNISQATNQIISPNSILSMPSSSNMLSSSQSASSGISSSHLSSRLSSQSASQNHSSSHSSSHLSSSSSSHPVNESFSSPSTHQYSSTSLVITPSSIFDLSSGESGVPSSFRPSNISPTSSPRLIKGKNK